jgi:hypothetical protein
LHVALVRVFRVEPAWVFPHKPVYGGCRSWVELPECPADTRLEPVIGDQEHRKAAQRFEACCSRDR